MPTATIIRELAEDYVRFQSLDKEKMDFTDHLKRYETLINKLEKAGVSFYDIGLYVHCNDKMST